MKTILAPLLLLVLLTQSVLFSQEETVTPTDTPVTTAPEKEPTKEASSKKDTKIDVSSEIVSDFIWRGMSFSGEAYNRRNNESYKSMNFVPSFQPTIDIHTPLDGFKVQLWGNFQLTDRENRDSDGKLLQSIV
jgi:hypothetical protein